MPQEKKHTDPRNIDVGLTGQTMSLLQQTNPAYWLKLAMQHGVSPERVEAVQKQIHEASETKKWKEKFNTVLDDIKAGTPQSPDAESGLGISAGESSPEPAAAAAAPTNSFGVTPRGESHTDATTAERKKYKILTLV